jgi:prenyltransferase/squalene oxidase-like repeat protein
MTPAERLNSHSLELSSDSLFAANFCLPFLRNAQNADGGWGFHPESQSRVEPTCWAILALQALDTPPISAEILDREFQFLRAAQLADGSWPASPEVTTGCWVTSLACWVLATDARANEAVAAGLKWLRNDWPRDSSPWRRLLGRFSSGRKISAQNDSYRGWGWTPRTSSWVEPTSFALILLAKFPAEALPKDMERRRDLARRMLYDRMCPGGGWNCGNPMVYGVAGEPLIVPTVWALLALRDDPNRPEFAMSLDWLEKNIENARGAGSLAQARICLEVCGRKWPATAATSADFYARNEFLQSVSVAAWTILACCKKHDWLTGRNRETS